MQCYANATFLMPGTSTLQFLQVTSGLHQKTFSTPKLQALTWSWIRPPLQVTRTCCQPRRGAASAQYISTLTAPPNSIFHQVLVPLDPLVPHLPLVFTSHLPLSWKSKQGQLSRSDCQQQVPHPQPCPCLTCLQISGMGAMVWKEKQKCSAAFQSKRQLFPFSASRK